MPPTLKAAGLTDVGRRREHNEDHILVDEELGLFAVADGMGGHAAGEVASHTAIDTIHDFLLRARNGRPHPEPRAPTEPREGLSGEQSLLIEAIGRANQRVCAAAEADQGSYGGMGTTLALLYLDGPAAHVCHIGDSRVYRLREGRLEALTQDHSWVNEQVQRQIITEEEARHHRWRNVITRALGNRQDVEVDMKRVEAAPGDRFLLCSDGLTSMVDDETIARCVAEAEGDLAQACARLVERANEAGGLDNISVVLIHLLP